MPKLSPERLDARREEILAAAQRAFAKHGYRGATVARLEAETGLSRGAIFNYFDDKQALFVEVAMRVNERFQRVFVEQGLEAAVREMAAEDPEWLAVLIETQSQLRHDEEFVRRLEAAVEAAPRASDWIARLQREGTVRDDLAPVALAQFVGMVLNGLALRVASQEETDVESLLRLLDDALAPRK